MRRKFSESVAVIIGASTGIGRATALLFADKRAVLAKAALAGAAFAMPLAVWGWFVWKSRRHYPTPRALARPPNYLESR